MGGALQICGAKPKEALDVIAEVNTADMAEPPSVTDHTTQFFD